MILSLYSNRYVNASSQRHHHFHFCLYEHLDLRDYRSYDYQIWLRFGLRFGYPFQNMIYYIKRKHC